MKGKRELISRKPFNIDRYTWLYEQKGGLLIVHEDRKLDGEFIQTHQFKIPLRKVKGYLRRRTNER